MSAHTVCAVEIEPYARAVLMARQDDGNLPAFPIWGRCANLRRTTVARSGGCRVWRLPVPSQLTLKLRQAGPRHRRKEPNDRPE